MTSEEVISQVIVSDNPLREGRACGEGSSKLIEAPPSVRMPRVHDSLYENLFFYFSTYGW